jgi:putative sigma-54 modulation protein
MRIDIQANHIDVNQQLEDTIREKVGKLEHYFENIVDAIVYLREESDHKEVEIKLNVRDNTLFIKENGESFQAALDIAVDVMKKQLKKYKEKQLKNI